MTRETLLSTQIHSAAESAQNPIPILGKKSILPTGRGVSWAAEWAITYPIKGSLRCQVGQHCWACGRHLALTRSFQSPPHCWPFLEEKGWWAEYEQTAVTLSSHPSFQSTRTLVSVHTWVVDKEYAICYSVYKEYTNLVNLHNTMR